jgi:hypothetical protein
MITGRNRRDVEPAVRRYERVCFTKDAVQPVDRPGVIRASMLHPGHPLMMALTDLVLEQNASLLRSGAILVDPADECEDPALLFLLTHEIKSGDDQGLSKRLQFVRVRPSGEASFAGWVPPLDLAPLDPADRPLLDRLPAEPWISIDQEQRVGVGDEHPRAAALRRGRDAAHRPR